MRTLRPPSALGRPAAVASTESEPLTTSRTRLRASNEYAVMRHVAGGLATEQSVPASPGETMAVVLPEGSYCRPVTLAVTVEPTTRRLTLSATSRSSTLYVSVRGLPRASVTTLGFPSASYVVLTVLGVPPAVRYVVVWVRRSRLS